MLVRFHTYCCTWQLASLEGLWFLVSGMAIPPMCGYGGSLSWLAVSGTQPSGIGDLSGWTIFWARLWVKTFLVNNFQFLLLLFNNLLLFSVDIDLCTLDIYCTLQYTTLKLSYTSFFILLYVSIYIQQCSTLITLQHLIN